MGKRRNGHMSERQLRMIELRAEGKTYSDIGKIYGLSIEGIRTNVRTAFRLLKRHGLDSLPPGCETRFSLNDLLSAGELRRNKTIDCKKPDVQQHVSVETPIGEISVGITQLDPDYPGIYVDLKGQSVNAQFEKDTVALAVIEFNPEKKNIQTLVWKDANQEDYTFAIEHENLVALPSLSKQIQSAFTRAAASEPTTHVKANALEPEI